MSRCMPPLSLEPSALLLSGGVVAGAELPSGPVVGGDCQYALGSVVGVGTYGEVRYGVSLSTGDRVAVKIVDLGRFSTETAALMRNEVRILRLIAKQPHQRCIRVIDVHEQVPLAGKWCDACACTCFKLAPPRAAQPAHPHAAGGAIPPPVKRAPIHSGSVCSVCSHTAAEHCGVSYRHSEFDPYAPADVGDDDDSAAGGEVRPVMLIVLELAAGGELFSLLSHSGPLPEDVARLYFQQLIEGIEHLHSLGISHRDLKPENLLTSDDFSLKIADFGLASLGTKMPVPATVDPANTTLALTQQHQHLQQKEMETRHFSGVGSLPYSAPEAYYVQLYSGRGYRGAPCDLWSAAVILFVMLQGRPPFVRPLAKTYGAHLRRCKHFVNLMAGNGMDALHPHAKDLLQRLLKLAPAERLTIAQIKQHPWFLGPTPSSEELQKIMEERSLRSWAGSHNNEMQHVLSKIRSTNREPLSTFGTPAFGPQSPSASPALGPHTALNSPSFSASSVPPSPYASAQAHPHSVRAHSPDSREHRQRCASNASPASFLAHGHSAFLSPSHHTGASSFLPPPYGGPTRHAGLHAHPGDSGAATPTTPQHAHGLSHTLASSINPAVSTVLSPHGHGSPTLLHVSLLQMGLHDTSDAVPDSGAGDGHSEIPPSLPEVPSGEAPAPACSDALARLSEQKHDEMAQQKLAAAAEMAAQHRREMGHGHAHCHIPSPRRAHLARYSSAPAVRGDESPPLEPSLLLASSFSFPPRSGCAHFVSTLDHDTLFDLLQARLEKRGARFHRMPPRGVAGGGGGGCGDHAGVAAHPGGGGGALEPGEECLLHVTTTFRGSPLVALLSIRSLRPPSGASGSVGPKGRLVLAEKIRANDAASFTEWFDNLTAGLREE